MMYLLCKNNDVLTYIIYFVEEHKHVSVVKFSVIHFNVHGSITIVLNFFKF